MRAAVPKVNPLMSDFIHWERILFYGKAKREPSVRAMSAGRS